MVAAQHEKSTHCAGTRTLLIDIKKDIFCEAGCKEIFDEQEYRVYYTDTEMWKLPINHVSENNIVKDLDLTIAAPSTWRHHITLA